MDEVVESEILVISFLIPQTYHPQLSRQNADRLPHCLRAGMWHSNGALDASSWHQTALHLLIAPHIESPS
jgi:hypothetical protein